MKSMWQLINNRHKHMKQMLLLFAILLVSSCTNKNKKTEVAIRINNEMANNDTLKTDIELEVYDFEGFKKFLNKSDNKIYVINFWATWCAPCIKELPYFEKLNEQYKDENVEVILVSLDFPHLYESKLKPFIVKKELNSKVIALDDSDTNTWIPQIDETWSGSIPATFIYKNDNKKFFEQSFNFEELEKVVKQFRNL